MKEKHNIRKPIIFGNCKGVLTIVLMFYFVANLAFGAEEEESEFCKRRWADFVQEREAWQEECWPSVHYVKNTSCCQETANHLEKRYDQYVIWCPIVGNKCSCNHTEQEINLIEQDALYLEVDWKKPTFFCSHKHIVNKYKVMIFDDKGGSWESSAKFVDEKPGDEEFPGVGSYKIKTTFELYGEINVTCNIDVNARSCVGNCKRDLWILWDNSQSTRELCFQQAVRPVLNYLVKSYQLNVGPYGTHIGIMTFNTTNDPIVLLEIGEKKTQTEIVNYLDSLKYGNISGNFSRVDMALEKIYQTKYKYLRAKNDRTDVKDVVWILTDERQILKKFSKLRYVQSFRNKKVVVAALAVGKKSDLKNSKNLHTTVVSRVKKFAISVSMQDHDLQRITYAVISWICSGPERCLCTPTYNTAYGVRDKEIPIYWEKPCVACTTGHYSREKVSSTRRPAVLGIGQHNISYTFTYVEHWPILKEVKCYAIINVQECVCPKDPQVILTKSPKSNMTLATWDEPKPNCTSTLISVTPNITKGEYISLPVGNHSIIYSYNIKNPKNSFNMSCYVNITVESSTRNNNTGRW